MNDRRKNNKYIVKSNTLIEARYRLSLQEQHVILWLLTQIKPEDDGFKTHSMRITEFAKMIGVDPNNQYKELRRVTMSLIKRGLEIYEPDLDEWLQVSWLSSARYKIKQGLLSLGFSSELKPYLLQLQRCFTKISLADALNFKSIYSYRLYELLVQHKNLGHRKMTIEELRTWCGITDGEYKDYYDLKRYAINRAKTEINTKTNYVIDYKEIKEGRKVTALEWTIDYKPTIEEPAPTTKSSESKEAVQVAPNYDGCVFPEMVEFCKIHESTLRRDLIDYLLQVVKFNKTTTTLELAFAAPFFRDRADVEEVHKALIKHLGMFKELCQIEKLS